MPENPATAEEFVDSLVAPRYNKYLSFKSLAAKAVKLEKPIREKIQEQKRTERNTLAFVLEARDQLKPEALTQHLGVVATARATAVKLRDEVPAEAKELRKRSMATLKEVRELDQRIIETLKAGGRLDAPSA